MADFGAPVAAGVNGPQQSIQTLSSLLGIKQQELALAQGQQQLSSQTSAATVAAIDANQQQALSQQNWGQFLKKDGSYDMEGASELALKMAPNLGPDFVSRLGTMSQNSTAAKKALYDLNQDQQSQVRSAYATWAADPKSTVTDLANTLEGIEDTVPDDSKDSIRKIINGTLGVISGPNLITGAPKTLQQQKNAALAYARAGLTTSESAGPVGLATPVPGTADTGTQVVPTTTNRITGITSPANAPPVANKSMPVTLPNGQQGILDLATGKISIAGASSPVPPPSVSSPAMTAENDPARPAPNAPAPVQQQWATSLQQAQASVQTAREADNNYGSNMAVAQDIRALSQSAGGKNVGPGTPEWTKLTGTLTSRFGGSQGVTNVQTLESFLDRQAASMSRAMGLPATNLGNEQARVIGGNIGMQAGALRAKNDYNEALTQGLHDYRQGLDKVAGFAGNASPTAVGQFRSQWAKYFNPMAYEYKLAQERGDREAMDAIAKSVSPAQARRMRVDLEMTDALVNTGKVP